MKKEERIKCKGDFTKLTQKRGISLIVLIITIIVIIILAAVVILNISKNNPVESAKEAKFKEDIRSFQDDLSLSISKDYTAKAGQRDDKFNATTFDEIKKLYIPCFTKEYEGKLVIKDDELKYVGDKVTEKEKKWLDDVGIKEDIKTAAEKVAEDASYYGKSITNYTANGVSDWKIFYSDGNNAYLIASDYVDVDKLPSTSKGHKPENTRSGCPKAATFDDCNVITDYSGSSDITDEKIKKLNNDYFSKGYTSMATNMKMVAYMLDTNIWSSFKAEQAEYAIGGPTIEMLMASYNKKYDANYMARVNSTTMYGYEISKDGGENWSSGYGEILNLSDSLYVISSSEDAYGMFLASPSNYNSYNYRGYCILHVTHRGSVADADFRVDNIGFRPIVCLNSNIQLEKDGDGYKIK